MNCDQHWRRLSTVFSSSGEPRCLCLLRPLVLAVNLQADILLGTARGVSLAEKYGIPIHAIGVGETADDLRPFEARAYARSLVGLEP